MKGVMQAHFSVTCAVAKIINEIENSMYIFEICMEYFK